jgi:hypothetical protein
MPAILVIVLIVVLIWLAFKFWYVTLALVAIGIAFYIVLQKRQAEDERRAAEERARAAEKAARAAAEWKRQEELKMQRSYLQQMTLLNDDSLKALESVPGDLNAAEQLLDRAEMDFAESAFAPFWDLVEQATCTLGRFDDRVRQINTNSGKYIDLVRKYDGSAPVFALSSESVSKLKTASNTSQRMSRIVRQAQRNFQFSMIYEQRKTNQILVAGFRTLAHALDQMTWQITSSIDNLDRSVNAMSSALTESLTSIHAQTRQLSDIVTAHTAEVTREGQGRVDREKNVIEMLDNIQRHRYPNIFNGGIR